ncbi:MAG: hypothetical protein PWQ41_1368 [Bacillota bacterium]|nr:hypothetical protein [Bacillota bacterium]MDK2856308.1 hypothetical protein [Bacillota bacterium]MDK2925594.1 hypothetical protein [Bacillota bacterium]
MRVAILADIHGNIHALDAVLADIEERRVDQILCLGDLVGYGAFPNEVIAAIRERAIPTVMGNYDESVGFDLPACGCDFPTEEALLAGEKSLAWTEEQVTEENKAFLRGLPRELGFDLGGVRTLAVHGSPRRLNEYLFDDTPDEFWATIFEPEPAAERAIYAGAGQKETRTATACQADLLVIGHTHKPYYRTFRHHAIVNAGSVGKPKHGDPQAVYALLSIGKGIEVEFVKVPYDVEAAAAAILAAGLPVEFAHAVRTGRA